MKKPASFWLSRLELREIGFGFRRGFRTWTKTTWCAWLGVSAAAFEPGPKRTTSP